MRVVYCCGPWLAHDSKTHGDAMHSRLTHRKMAVVLGAIVLIVNGIPRWPDDSLEFGWPLSWVKLSPIRIEMRTSPKVERALIDQMWRDGFIGPSGARVEWAPGWRWVRLPIIGIAICSPLRCAGNAALVVCVLSIAWIAVARSYGDKRRYNGDCATCGYNLTGNESGRCPECGSAVEASTARGPLM